MSTLPVRYAGWMTRDLVRGPGLAMIVLAVLTIFLDINVNNESLFGVRRLSMIFVLLVTAGIVSRDAAGGYHRTLFAKPVSPPLYYLQRWILGAVVVMVALYLVDLGLAERLRIPAIGPSLLPQVGLLYLLVGGLVLLLSTFTRHDWLIAVVLMLVHSTVDFMRSIDMWFSALPSAVYAILPPFHLVAMEHPVTWAEQVHAGLYGLALLLAALVMLRWYPLGTGRRE